MSFPALYAKKQVPIDVNDSNAVSVFAFLSKATCALPSVFSLANSLFSSSKTIFVVNCAAINSYGLVVGSVNASPDESTNSNIDVS